MSDEIKKVLEDVKKYFRQFGYLGVKQEIEHMSKICDTFLMRCCAEGECHEKVYRICFCNLFCIHAVCE